MKVSDIFNIVHNALEAKNNGKKISQRAMAEELGVSMRTYQDWRTGKAQPIAARALMQMLGELDDDEIVRVVKKIRSLNEQSDAK
ncbi:helix-turn-helix domain-containing protein [Hydrogenimonas urashimensis]|uniref:helix-turn-helix domain-containing protein n=1 Tax=Hydrogenimonas urashimensis TaxID=2740515 RepID=UPI0019156245|nr:helix-turn-helix transcriptional regulator [Hydrogenimonas urashimensis]